MEVSDEVHEACKQIGELAFEHGFTDSPDVLWRLTYLRPQLRGKLSSEWFAIDGEELEHRIDYLRKNGATCIFVTKYAMVKKRSPVSP